MNQANAKDIRKIWGKTFGTLRPLKHEAIIRVGLTIYLKQDEFIGHGPTWGNMFSQMGY